MTTRSLSRVFVYLDPKDPRGKIGELVDVELHFARQTTAIPIADGTAYGHGPARSRASYARFEPVQGRAAPDLADGVPVTLGYQVSGRFLRVAGTLDAEGFEGGDEQPMA